MNIFAAQFLSSISGLNASAILGGALSSADGAGSPFALLVKQGGEQDGLAKPVSGLLQNNKGFAQIDADGNIIETSSSDLSSPELLLSDLLAVNWQSLENGESITLPSGWTLSSNGDGLLSLADPDGQNLFPSFSKDELRELLATFQNPDIFFPLNALSENIIEAKNSPDVAALKKENAASIKSDIASEAGAPKLQKEAAQIVTQSDNVQKIVVNTSPVKTIAATVAAPLDIGAATNPLQPLWNAVIEAQQRDAYLHAPTSVYASLGSVRGIITPANSNMGQVSASLPGAASSSSSDITVSDSTSPLLISDEPLLSSGDFIDDLMADAASIPMMMQQQGIRVSNDGNLVGTQPLAPAQLNLIIQKMADRNETRTLTVRLDPPELGRVQVSLSSGADKIVKAHIMVERPEALALLKRDMASLEKALHDSGLSLDGDSVSMELAGDDSTGGGFAQQAFMDLWSESNETRQIKTGAELAVDNNVASDDAADTNEFYQSDTAVNIKV